tara:strand:- start:9223 stop:9477 length:255 start_codon:yes stop_codon:yes gene_type:complete
VGGFRVEKQEGGVVGVITVLREMHLDSERVGDWVSVVDSGTGSMLDAAWEVNGMWALLVGVARMIRENWSGYALDERHAILYHC